MRTLLLWAASLALVGCDQVNPQWKGWVYPNGHDLTTDIPLGRFSTIEECRATAEQVLRYTSEMDEDGSRIEGDYECGYKCRVDDSIGKLNVCERTER